MKISRPNQIAAVCALVSYLMNRPCRFNLGIQATFRVIGKRPPVTCDFEVRFYMVIKLKWYGKSFSSRRTGSRGCVILHLDDERSSMQVTLHWGLLTDNQLRWSNNCRNVVKLVDRFFHCLKGAVTVLLLRNRLVFRY